MNDPKPSRSLILILGMLSAIGPLSIDMYLPAFPALAQDLDTTVAQVTLSLSSFFVGISVGQLIYGPLLERYGRKTPLLIGLAIYLLGSVGCALATSVNALIVLRLVQALGGCAGLVASRAIVRDLFDARQSARVFSMLMLVVAVSPIIAPTLGGYVTAGLGWRYVFAVLAVVSFCILIGVYVVLPRSPSRPDFSLKPPVILGTFRRILQHPQFYTYALTGAVAYAGLYAYISGSPYVFMELFRVSEQQYGWIFALISLGLIGATQVNNWLLRHYSSEQIIWAGTLGQSLIGLLFVTLTALGWSDLYVTIAFVLLFLGGQGLIFPNASALALAPFAQNAGSASALLGALQLSIGAGASALMSVLQNQTALPMAGVMAGAALGALLVFWAGRTIISRQPTSTDEENVETIRSL